MARADEWSEDLSRALLAVPFTLRSKPSDQDGTTEQLLIKVIAHAPSQTMAIVVVPLSTLAVLYEGLSLRTMQRRAKFDPPLPIDGQSQQTQTQSRGFGESLPSLTSSLSSSISPASAAMFDNLAAWVRSAILDDGSPAPGGSKTWYDDHIGRSEATIDFHLETSQTPQQKVVASFDLAALDKDEGPAFLRDHLLAPALGLAADGIEARLQHQRGPPDASGMEAVTTRLFGQAHRGDTFAAYARAIAGMDDEEAGTARGPTAAQPPTAAKTPSPAATTASTSSPDASRARSRTRSATQSESPEPRAQNRPAPPTTSLSSSPPRPSAQSPPRMQPHSVSPPRAATTAIAPAQTEQLRHDSGPARSAMESDDEEDEEMLGPRRPISQQPRPPSPSPAAAARATTPPPAQSSSMPTSTQTTPAKDGTKDRATAGPRTGGRGASSYRRGLAKRQRI